ncbi:MAG: DUF58 domain-containing protein [Nanoarchaeota archaeon]|nr:DUF58 domain-containing protein [Nanoarchaeota archaeon]
MAERKLNIDIAGAISEFEAAAKEFELKEKIYKILFRGKGLEFESYREYSPEDDAEDIDWKASMRGTKMLVKRYIEERDLGIVFIIDVSENMVLGSHDKLKCEYAAELIGALAHLMLNSNDKIGFIFFSDRVKEYVPPKKGLNQLYLLVDLLSDPNMYQGGSNIRGALKYATEYLNETVNSVVFVSDFIKMNDDCSRDWHLLGHRFETMGIMVKDPLDKTLPDMDREIVIENPSTGEQILINPKKSKAIYEKYAIQQENFVKDVFRKANIDVLPLMTDIPFVYPLAEFLKERVEKKGFFV